MIKDLIAKIDSKQRGYLSNTFGQGIKDIENLL